MWKFNIFLFLIFLNLKSALTLYYACPPTSVCVPPKNCKPENITFDATSHNINGQEFKYVCGILSECEDHVCCNDPIEMSSNFEPNKTHWCYLKESFVESLKIDVLVYPYPGLEEPQTKENLYNVPALCPPGSICVPGSICSLEHISYSFGFSGNEFSCGNHPGSIGNICCTISGMFEPIQKVPEIKPHFMKTKNDAVTRRDSQWSFMESDYFPDNDVEVNKQKLYNGASGRSAKTQEWVCGRTLSIANELNRIYAPFGDREAKEGDYPWHVAILSSSSYKYLCSGAIIDEKTVVTIAHCFDKHHSAGEILVRVGDLNLQLDTEKNPAFDVRVKHLIIHPNYNKINLDADIAILEMEESVRSLPHVKPVCLPHKNYSPVINQCKVPGWGQFSKSKEEKNEFNYALRAARFYIIDKTQCQNSLRKVKELGAFFKLQKRVLCAKGYSNADTCKGDGGSGLVCRDKDVYVLKGLVSYGFGCGLDLPGVYTDVEKYLYFINNYKKFIPTSSGKVSTEDFGSTYIERKLHSSEKQKYTDLEAEDKIPSYITVQNEKIDPPSYITVQKKVDPPTYINVQNDIDPPTYINVQKKVDPPAYITVQNDYQSSSKTNYVEEAPVKVSYNENQFIPISNPYETLEEEPYTYIKPQEPEYVKRPEFNPNSYQPEKKVNVYTQNFIEDIPKYEENYSPNFDFGFSNSRDDEYDGNLISRTEYKPEKLQYGNDENFIENTYEVPYNREGYSDITDPRDYDSGHLFDRRPSSNDYDSTLSDFGYEDTLSYQPDYRPNEDSIYQPDYIRPNEDSIYEPDYTKPNEDSIYQPDYTKPNKDSIYQPDYIRPNEDSIFQPDYKRLKEESIYQPDYTRTNEDSIYEPDYTGPNEDSIYQPDYTRPNEDSIYQPDYTGPNVDSLSYRPDKRPYADKLSYQPDNARSDYDTISDELDYSKREFNYRPVNDFEEYHSPKGDYLSRNDQLFYEDFDNLGYGKGLRRPSRISPKNANVKTYSKKASGKASGSSNFEASVKKGKVTSPLALLKNKFWVK